MKPICYCFSFNSKILLWLEPQLDEAPLNKRCVDNLLSEAIPNRSDFGHFSFVWKTFNLETKQVTSYTPFKNCHYLANIYLPFFAQYFQSLTLFSPDSKVWRTISSNLQ